MRSSPLSFLERPIVPIAMFGTLAVVSLLPLVYARVQEVQATPERALFIEDRTGLPEQVHRRLFDALDRGERATVADVLRAEPSGSNFGLACLIVDAPDAGAQSLRGEACVERLLELWPPLRAADAAGDATKRCTSIAHCAVLKATPDCRIVVLEISRPGIPSTEDLVEKPQRFFLTSVIVRDGPGSAEKSANPETAPAGAGGDSRPPADAFRIAHLHVSRAD